MQFVVAFDSASIFLHYFFNLQGNISSEVSKSSRIASPLRQVRPLGPSNILEMVNLDWIGIIDFKFKFETIELDDSKPPYLTQHAPQTGSCIFHQRRANL